MSERGERVMDRRRRTLAWLAGKGPLTVWQVALGAEGYDDPAGRDRARSDLYALEREGTLLRVVDWPVRWLRWPGVEGG